MKVSVVRGTDIKDLINSRAGGGLILSALNLFMLGFLRRHPEFPMHSIFWCDGLMGCFYVRLKGGRVRKTRGAELLKSILAVYQGKSICVLGSLDEDCREVLRCCGIDEIQHFELKNFNLDDFSAESVDLPHECVVITLPSPKQELLALKLAVSFPSRHFYCVGGALNILAYPELDCPRGLQVFGLEFLFRLRSDTRRRVHRLFNSLMDALRNVAVLFRYEVVIIERPDLRASIFERFP